MLTVKQHPLDNKGDPSIVGHKSYRQRNVGGWMSQGRFLSTLLWNISSSIEVVLYLDSGN